MPPARGIALLVVVAVVGADIPDTVAEQCADELEAYQVCHAANLIASGLDPSHPWRGTASGVEDSRAVC